MTFNRFKCIFFLYLRTVSVRWDITDKQTDRYFIARKKVNPDLFVIEIREIYVHVYTRLLICYIKIIWQYA